MGACMAPAAADTIERHLEDFHVQPQEYDRIITGDLGSVGQDGGAAIRQPVPIQ